MNDRTNILLPIETINRELDFKLYLGGMYARNDNRIYIGQHDLLHNTLLPTMQGGVYVGKNLFPTHFPTPLNRYHALKKNGFNVVHLDEEGAIYQNDDPEYWKRILDYRLDINVLQETDRVCVWGDFQKEYYTSLRKDFADKIVTTGHPRFDLYKPQYRSYFQNHIDSIKDKYGDFILINTNLTVANNINGIENSFSVDLGYEPEDPEMRLAFLERWRYTSHTLANFVCMVHKINAAHPELTLVLRPHPSENWDYYKQVFRGLKNVHVVHEGPVGAWIMAAKAMIHDGCTTAVEGFLAQKPIINFRSIDDPKSEYFIPNNLKTMRARTDDEVVAAVESVLDGTHQLTSNDLPQAAFDMFHNFKSDKGFEAVVEQMRIAENQISCKVKTPSIGSLSSQLWRLNQTEKLKKIARPFFPEKLRRYKSGRNQFYGFTQEILDQKMEFIQNQINKTVNYKLYGDNLIVIESE